MSDFIPSVKDYLQICCDANSRAWKGRFCARTAGWFFVSQKAQFTHFRFMDKKRAEGKPYRVYMMASANKFLRIYYATVKAYLESLEHTA